MSTEAPFPLDASDFTYSDLKNQSNLYAAEFNEPALHDRVLVLDILSVSAKPLSNQEPLGNTVERFSSGKISGERYIDKEDWVTGVSEVVAVQDERKRSLQTHEESAKDLKKPRVMPELSFERETMRTTTINEGSSSGVEDEDSGTSETDVELVSNIADKLDCSFPSSSEDLGGVYEIVRQHKLFIHSSWLAVHSSYFRSLFYSGMSESLLKEVHLKIPASEEKGHLLLLEAIYRADVLNNTSLDELLVVLELANKYDIKFVFRKCQYLLKGKLCSIEACKKFIDVVYGKLDLGNNKELDFTDLMKTLQMFLLKEFNPLDMTWHSSSFINLSTKLLGVLLDSSDLEVQSENTVFHAVMQWVKCKPCCKKRKQAALSCLIPMIRFELMTVDYLCNVVQTHSMMTCFKDHYLAGIAYHALSPEARECLKVKPEPRINAKSGGEIVHYKWTLLKTTLDNLSQGDELTSDQFWACGYKMKLTLKRKGAGLPQLAYYTVAIRLQIVSSCEETYVPLNWAIKSEKIFRKIAPCKRVNFSANCRNSPYESLALLKGDEQSYDLGLIVELL